jgi:hypothetical protein
MQTPIHPNHNIKKGSGKIRPLQVDIKLFYISTIQFYSFDMQACTSQSIVKILQSSREATLTIMVQTISTNIYRQVEDCH